jgi:tetratricopeptide (TPR) repeat protein
MTAQAKRKPQKKKRERTQEIKPRVASPRRFQLHELRPWLLLVGATLLAYLPALNGGFVWDDEHHVTAPALQSLEGLGKIWFHLGATAQYYPLLHSAFWIEHQLWGDATFGYHLINVLLHALSACLVVLIARRLSLAGTWLAGFVFALHPVCVEAVAWISEQKSTLSGMFYLGSALAYLYFDQTRRRSRYLLALALFVLALLSKTVTATLPAALLVVLWWKHGRWLAWRRDIMPLLAWLPLGAAAGLFTAWVEKTYIGAAGGHYSLSAIQRVLLAGRVIWFYADKIVWPVNLIFTYPRWTVDPGQWWQWLFPAGVVVAFIGLAFLARRNRGPLAAALIFVGTLFPVLGFLNVYPFRFSWVADHFQYLASLAVIVPLSSALTAAAKQKLTDRNRIALGAVLVATLGVLTWRQCGMYRDAETLYRETLRRNPASYMAHSNLGTLLMSQPGRMADAVAQLQTAIRLQPDDADTHLDLGVALEHTPGRAADAIAEYETAVRLNPGNATARYDLGSSLIDVPGRLPEAIAQLQQAVRLQPDFESAHLALAAALSRIPNRLSDAAAEYWAALQIEPGNAKVHVELGDVLARIPGRSGDAIVQYQAALSLHPGWQPVIQRLKQLQAGK